MVALLLVFLAGKCLRGSAGQRFPAAGNPGGGHDLDIPSVRFHPGRDRAGAGSRKILSQRICALALDPWYRTGWLASFRMEYLVSLRHIVAD